MAQGSQTMPALRVSLPVLPILKAVQLPEVDGVFYVNGEAALAALERAESYNNQVFVAMNLDSWDRDLTLTERSFAEVGTIAQLSDVTMLPDGFARVSLRGQMRASMESVLLVDGAYVGRLRVRKTVVGNGDAAEKMREFIDGLINEYVAVLSEQGSLIHVNIPSIEKVKDPSAYTYFVASELDCPTKFLQQLLDEDLLAERMRMLRDYLSEEILKQRVKSSYLEGYGADKDLIGQVFSRRRRSGSADDDGGFYEGDDAPDSGDRAEWDGLGDSGFDDEFEDGVDADDGDAVLERSGLNDLRLKLRRAQLPLYVREHIVQELKKMSMMSSFRPEQAMSRAYVEYLLSLPWMVEKGKELNLKAAEETLNEQHYGLEQVKDRILEYLSVRKLRGDAPGQVLCFTGPPGVGKTTLARSIADTLGRDFVRISLGGVHLEADIRGHRRTFVGAQPGNILEGIRRAGSINPVILLDEIDKTGRSVAHGDPASALLEVLDPAQNSSFKDHYVDIDFDLSKVFFIATANSLQTIPAPLLDRMEIVELRGYSDEEKLQIAEQFLVPQQLDKCGLANLDVQITTPALVKIIRDYAVESGVRLLDRSIATALRKVARAHVDDPSKKRFEIDAEQVETYLGPPTYDFDHALEDDEIGVATGLAWRSVGGTTLSVEVTLMQGSGTLTITGQLGDVMQESAKAALSYVRSRAANLGIDPEFHKTTDIHFHFPKAASPKDGPSAGITMATALVSALTDIPVRADVAMTGEITLRGRVLVVGGIREKLLAAYRAGIKRVLIPERNVKDLVELPDRVREEVEVVPVKHFDKVLELALAHSDLDEFLRRLNG